MCHESLHEPMRTLSCLHSACLNCFDQWISQSIASFISLPSCFSFFLLFFSFLYPQIISSDLGQAPLRCPLCRAVLNSQQRLWFLLKPDAGFVGVGVGLLSNGNIVATENMVTGCRSLILRQFCLYCGRWAGQESLPGLC